MIYINNLNGSFLTCYQELFHMFSYSNSVLINYNKVSLQIVQCGYKSRRVASVSIVSAWLLIVELIHTCLYAKNFTNVPSIFLRLSSESLEQQQRIIWLSIKIGSFLLSYIFLVIKCQITPIISRLCKRIETLISCKYLTYSHTPNGHDHNFIWCRDDRRTWFIRPALLFMRGVVAAIPRRLQYLNCNKLSPLTREMRKICNRTSRDHRIRGSPPLCKQCKQLCNRYRIRPAMTPTRYFIASPTGSLSRSRLETFTTKGQREISPSTFCHKWRGVCCPMYIKEQIGGKSSVIVVLFNVHSKLAIGPYNKSFNIQFAIY